MVILMETIPTKLTAKLTHEIDKLVEEGWYASRSEAIRDAVRELVERKRLTRLKKAVDEDLDWGLHSE